MRPMRPYPVFLCDKDESREMLIFRTGSSLRKRVKDGGSRQGPVWSDNFLLPFAVSFQPVVRSGDGSQAIDLPPP